MVLTSWVRVLRTRYTRMLKAAKSSGRPTLRVRLHDHSHSKYGDIDCPLRRCHWRTTRNAPTIASETTAHDAAGRYSLFLTRLKPRHIPATNNNCQDMRSK